MIPVRTGQRWINHARPELGLGLVITADNRAVTLRFGEDEHDHVFALESAPLSRIRFSVGDVVRLSDGDRVAVSSVQESEGVLIYSGTNAQGRSVEFVETAIAADQSFNRPVERLLHGQIDEDRWFSLRHRTLEVRCHLYRDPLWGLLGGRTALLPHQLHVASEVASRHAPRVLLADEVGLGKTIEAGLIAHYQLVTERVRRVLIVVPESLVHQWLVEMLRRFNLMFRVFDAQRCDSMDSDAGDAPDVGGGSAVNPFAEEQLVLVSREFLVDDPRRRRQCAEAGWDLLIVDEAHHLSFDEQGPSPAYKMVEMLASVSPGVLLLTGTPRQLGAAGHFSRLRLLDPDRYHDPAMLEREQQEFEPVADLVEALSQDQPLDQSQLCMLEGRELLEDRASIDERSTRDRLVDRLLDRFGTGRVMFRNSRASVSGFPRRRVFPHTLGAMTYPGATFANDLQEALYPERRFIATAGVEAWAQRDPRVRWLGDWLRDNAREKALVICSSRVLALALTQALKQGEGISCAAFHEDLTLIERDRAAAWFADPDEECQALVCSEIGSEGRNFQFAHHLVLFDLPISPDLLEQRIGRLDRIGRADDVLIQVPYLADTPQQRLFEWFHEGLDAFQSIGSVNQLVLEEVRDALEAWLRTADADVGNLIETTRALRARYQSEMRAGRDRLLEYHSCRPGRAEAMVAKALESDQKRSVRDWVELASTCYDLVLEPYRAGSVLIKPGARLLTPIPGLPDEGLSATFTRNIALENEDLQFLTWEHPVVEALGDLVLNTERGNATICAIRHRELPRGRVAVECVFVVEAPLFSRPELACYVPPLLVCEIHDETGQRLDPRLDHDAVSAGWVPLKYKASRQVIEIKRQALQGILERAGDSLEQRAGRMLLQHGRPGLETLKEELARLRYLSTVNPNVRPEEIRHHEAMIESVAESIRHPRIRLDAVRVIVGL